MSTNARVRPVVSLVPDRTLVAMSPEDRSQAVGAAMWITASPHEWAWTQDQQELMARFVLWSVQRLSGIEQLVSGELGHYQADPMETDA